MLKGIDPLLDARLLQVLAAMGHGDDLVLVDRNFPAESVARATVSGTLVRQDGVDTTRMARAILSVFPLDSFVEAPVLRMEKVDAPEELLEVHLRKLIDKLAPDAGQTTDREASWTRGSPFRGLEAFGFEHAAIFFGRTRAVASVLDGLRKQAAARPLGLEHMSHPPLVRFTPSRRPIAQQEEVGSGGQAGLLLWPVRFDCLTNGL